MNKVILLFFCAVIATAYSKNVDTVEKPLQGIGLCLVKLLQGILDCVKKNPPAEEPQNFGLCLLKVISDFISLTALQEILSCVQNNPPAEEPQKFVLCLSKVLTDFINYYNPYKKIINRCQRLLQCLMDTQYYLK
ncbi:unnamed protein product [Leptidea sinapis]|uniref:Saposin B-type domain-containing protein n=1 Tax=Leptidea sinapis TaxID=189913 RepID=A0A5E4QRT0_9NEOP|nr:unnamed protein product [Leptidea sinapis]